MLAKKNASSIEIEQRNAKSGQVSGGDKNARVSDAETFAMNVIGADKALKEFMSIRADDMTGKMEMLKNINRDGYVSLKDMPNDVKNKQALNTLDVFFLSAGIVTDLITPGLALRDTLDNKQSKQKLDSKYVDKNRN